MKHAKYICETCVVAVLSENYYDLFIRPVFYNIAIFVLSDSVVCLRGPHR